MSTSPISTSRSSEPVIRQPDTASDSSQRAPRTVAQRTWPLVVYLILSVALFGIPVLGHFGTHIIAFEDGDPSVIMWWLAWWPHALLHGLNPFVTHAILYPDGYNLEWATSMPLPSIVLAPVTLGFGPAVTWNVIQLLSPALSAWTAFLLCRHVVGRTVPALVGGYVFGFSPYMLTHLQSSPNLALVALIPIFVLIVLRRLEGKISPRRFVVEMTLALVAQYLIGTEVLATAAVFGILALALAAIFMPERRAGLWDVAKLLVVSFAATAILISPFLYYFLFGAHYPPFATQYSADLASFALPPNGVALRFRSGPLPFGGSTLEDYLGLPLLLLMALFLWSRRRERSTWWLALVMFLLLVASLGTRLGVRASHTGIWLPWDLFSRLPLLHYAIPQRFILYVTLPAAVIVAMWLNTASRRGRPESVARWALALLAVAFIVPSVGAAAWNTAITEPPFFQHHAYRRYLNSSDHVLTIPFWGPNQRWIADAGFPFALSAGSGGQGEVPGYTRFPIWTTLSASYNAFHPVTIFPYPLPADYAYQLRRFLKAKHVTAVVVEQNYPGPWSKLFGTLGVRPVATGGVLLYRLRGTTATVARSPTARLGTG